MEYFWKLIFFEMESSKFMILNIGEKHVQMQVSLVYL